MHSYGCEAVMGLRMKTASAGDLLLCRGKRPQENKRVSRILIETHIQKEGREDVWHTGQTFKNSVKLPVIVASIALDRGANGCCWTH